MRQPVLAAALMALLVAPRPAAADTDQQWLDGIRLAGRQLDYRGTFVVQSQQQLLSYDIQHVMVQGHALQLVRAQDGQRRLELSRDDQTWVILPGSRQVLELQNLPMPQGFPRFLSSLTPDVLRAYSVRHEGQQRCLDRRCDVTEIVPRDDLRYGYRLWSDAQTHLLLRLQMLDANGQALQQLAFTHVDEAARSAPDLVARTLEATRGWSHQQISAQPTTPVLQGWRMRQLPPGFQPQAMVERTMQGADQRRHPALQWLFSDGLASVSVFIGHDLPDPGAANRLRFGPTHALQGRLGDWSVVAVGNVPEPTLQRLVQGLQRAP